MEFESSILNVGESDCYANVTVVKRGSTTGNIRVAVRTVNGTARGKDWGFVCALIYLDGTQLTILCTYKTVSS